MHYDEEYRLAIRLARNSWIIRNTRDLHLRARVSKDSQAIRRELKGVV